ncbi:MAG TPA: SRPBCC domain-containing protein [Burkholderiaceae bacterium]
MTDIIHRIGIKAPAADVHAALSTIPGLAGWWTEQTSGSSRVGELVAFRFHLEDGSLLGGFDMEVTELSPEDKVRWRVKDGPPEWIGTDIEFSLLRQEDWTVVMFGHRGWREEVEFTAHCSTKWATFLVSLRDFVETGKGRPAPNDVRIGDWH